MSDCLYLSLWFDDFRGPRMMAYALSVLRQFPFSAQQPGISYLALHPVSWNEPTILERRFRPGIDPEEAVQIASDLLHDDYAEPLIKRDTSKWTSDSTPRFFTREYNSPVPPKPKFGPMFNS